MNIFLSYVRFYLKAKGRHSVHSPFVYDFLDKCLATKMDINFKIAYKKLNKYLKNATQEIEIADFGAGSRKLKNVRTVKQMFATSASKGKYAELLYQIAKFYQPQNSLEFGTNLGLGAIHLAAGNLNGRVTSVDACQNTLQEAEKHIQMMGLKNIYLVHKEFDTYFDSLSSEKFDLIFIDGNHQGKALKKYLYSLEKHAHDETIFILDDIRWNQDMLDAWTEIYTSEKYHLSLDLLKFGIVMKRPHQVKEHFILKH